MTTVLLKEALHFYINILLWLCLAVLVFVGFGIYKAVAFLNTIGNGSRL
ncbi:hypothetical protein IYQ92_00595 [Streptococcus sp. HF-1907]|nr:hypothetical protein [Streptococcus sp. HF-1907]MBF7093800.1 hypothetical protein [Streptococcus sp. HF-1907]